MPARAEGMSFTREAQTSGQDNYKVRMEWSEATLRPDRID